LALSIFIRTTFMETSSMPDNMTSIQKSSCCSPAAGATAGRSEWSYSPAIDVYETPTEFVIEADSPGLKAEGIDLAFENGVLKLHGQVVPRSHADASPLRQEYGVGDFDREIPLGRVADRIDGAKIAAEYAHGVLTIHLPKLEAAKSRRIEVKKNFA
jgi:HSP20 family protein